MLLYPFQWNTSTWFTAVTWFICAVSNPYLGNETHFEKNRSIKNTKLPKVDEHFIKLRRIACMADIFLHICWNAKHFSMLVTWIKFPPISSIILPNALPMYLRVHLKRCLWLIQTHRWRYDVTWNNKLTYLSYTKCYVVWNVSKHEKHSRIFSQGV